MSQPAIKIDGLGKRYKLGVTHAGSIRNLVNGVAGKLVGRGRKPQSDDLVVDPNRIDDDGHFWALKDVSFEVQPGEVVGIIGKNGAGKSTLLKLLSRITTPTTGEIQLRGRVASLLEVGTGFHPELTGRENVYLNGTILGMTKREVDRQFDAIVDFAGIEKFIDTPVKRYSSGMTVRLGFAVAAHLEPEILIVDEVLAVGDVEFQRRCLGKMEDAAESGKTVLFVSHNLASIRTLTRRTVLLRNGELVVDCDTQSAITEYLRLTSSRGDAGNCVHHLERPFGGLDRKVEIVTAELGESRVVRFGESLRLTVGVKMNGTVDSILIGVTVFDDQDQPIGTGVSDAVSLHRRETTVDVMIGDTNLAPGNYYFAISTCDVRSRAGRLYDAVSGVVPFEVIGFPSNLQRWHRGWGSTCWANVEATVNDCLELRADVVG